MFVVTNLYLVLLYLFIFMLGYFLFERTASWKRVASLNTPIQARDFVRGIYFGFLTLIATLINELLEKQYALPLFVITAILIAFYKNYLSSLYSLIPSLIYWGLKTGGSSISILIAVSIFVTLIAIEVTKYFDLNSFSLVALILLPISLINFLVGAFGLHATLEDSFVQTTLPYLFAALCGFVLLWFIKFSVSSRLLYESANFKFEGWYRTGLAQKSFANFVSTNKINRAFFCVLRIDFDKKIDDNQNEEIIRTYLEGIRKQLGERNLFFAVTKDIYGFVVPYRGKITLKKSLEGNKSNIRVVDDMLSELEREVRMAPKVIMTSWDEKIDVKPRVGVSIYGLETSSFVKLITDSSFALVSSTSKNLVSLFNFREYEKARNNERQISQMDKNIVLDDYAMYFLPLINVKKKSTAMTYAHIKNVAEYDYYESVNDIVYSKDWETTFNRYFAADALKKSNGRKVGFDYSLTIFENDFDHDHFVSFVEQEGNKLSNLFLFITKESINKVKNISKVKAEIARLEGINFVIDNEADAAKVRKIFKEVQYVYRDFASEEVKFPDAKIISFNLQTEEDAKTAIKNGSNIIGGELFENKIIFTKFDKQSKIYLESILKGRR